MTLRIYLLLSKYFKFFLRGRKIERQKKCKIQCSIEIDRTFTWILQFLI